MNEEFDLPVSYNGKELMLKARLVTQGYTHKIQVEVNGQEISYEPDEERNYRALVNTEHANATHVDHALLQTIAETIEAIFKG